MYNTDAEKALIATILNNPELYITDLIPEDFYIGDEKTANTRKVFGSIISLAAKGKDFTDLTLLASETSMTREYLQNFVNYTHDPKNVADYVGAIKTASKQRTFTGYTTELQRIIRDEGEQVEKMNALESVFADLRTVEDGGLESNHISQIVKKYREKAYRDKDIPLADRVIKTGFVDYDNLIGGYYRGQTSILAARPGMGKTSLASQIRMSTKRPTANFILETSPEQLLQREISNISGIPIKEIIELTFFNDKDKEIRFLEALAQQEVANTYLFGSDYADFLKLKQKMRELTHVGVELIVIDFLQTVSYPQRSREGRAYELSNIMQELAQFAASEYYNSPHILIASQLNRGCEDRQDKRPELSDLKGSGGTEEFTHQVTFMYRDAYYNPDTERKTVMGDIVELLVKKNRNGATGSADMIFDGKSFKFYNLQRVDHLF